MKAYHFLSQHPKCKVESPTDGSKPTPKNPNSIRKDHVPEELEDAFNDNEESNTFVKLPSRKDRPNGREKSNQVDAVNLIVDKVSERVSLHQTQDTTTLQDMWLKIETALKMTSRHMKSNVKNQIMANAPSPVRTLYFDNLYHSITVEAETHALESDTWKKKAELEK